MLAYVSLSTAMLCYAMLSYVILCYAILCYVSLSSAILPYLNLYKHEKQTTQTEHRSELTLAHAA